MADGESTVEEAKQMVRSFCEARDWDRFHTPKNLSIGIVTEASELLALFRFMDETESLTMLRGEDFRNKVGEELADVYYFLLRFAQRNSFDLTDELARKMAINESRYPVSKAKGSNRKYDKID
ncbi:MAG TPA: nucleotide pyrophosphohydrolase [Methanomassiliicoccales archaeon]|nr:nucleotide pyrophosphohydrolase [Methanomassiliicoccales archaeon]